MSKILSKIFLVGDVLPGSFLILPLISFVVGVAGLTGLS